MEIIRVKTRDLMTRTLNLKKGERVASIQCAICQVDIRISWIGT